MAKWLVKTEGTTPLLMHKFIGIAEAKTAKEKLDQAQAETFAYRDKHGELCVPARNMRSCIVEGFVSSAGAKMKTSTKMSVAPRIRVTGADGDPLNIPLNVDTYEIDKQSAFSGSRNAGVRDWCIRPIIPEWAVEFTLDEGLGIDEKELLYKLNFAGGDVGVLSNRPNGYGRFKVVSLEKLKQ